jgi:hypothetical protein
MRTPLAMLGQRWAQAAAESTSNTGVSGEPKLCDQVVGLSTQ